MGEIFVYNNGAHAYFVDALEKYPQKVFITHYDILRAAGGSALPSDVPGYYKKSYLLKDEEIAALYDDHAYQAILPRLQEFQAHYAQHQLKFGRHNAENSFVEHQLQCRYCGASMHFREYLPIRMETERLPVFECEQCHNSECRRAA